MPPGRSTSATSSARKPRLHAAPLVRGRGSSAAPPPAASRCAAAVDAAAAPTPAALPALSPQPACRLLSTRRPTLHRVCAHCCCCCARRFGDVRHPWNRAHDKARQIYNSPLMLKGVRSQHAALYATHLGKSRAGVLRDAADFFALFNNGVRGGQRRYFTYSLLPDSLRCSETGATFAADMMSKHAMHAGGAEEVLYAGGRAGGWVSGGRLAASSAQCSVPARLPACPAPRTPGPARTPATPHCHSPPPPAPLLPLLPDQRFPLLPSCLPCPPACPAPQASFASCPTPPPPAATAWCWTTTAAPLRPPRSTCPSCAACWPPTSAASRWRRWRRGTAASTGTTSSAPAGVEGRRRVCVL